MLSFKYSLLTTSVLLSLGLSPAISAAPVATSGMGSNISITTPITGPDEAYTAPVTTNVAAPSPAPAPASTSNAVAASSSTTSSPVLNSTPIALNSDRPNYTIEFAQPAPAPAASVTAPTAAAASAPAPAAAPAAAPASAAQGTGMMSVRITTVRTDGSYTSYEPSATAAAPAPAPAAQGSALAPNAAPVNPAMVSSGVSVSSGNEQGYITEQLRPAYGQNGQSQPSFTFEEQTSSTDVPLSTGSTAAAGAAAGTAGSGALAGGAAPGNVTMGSETSLQPEVGEQQQEVSVSVLGTFDQALTEAFESLESGLTLGLSTTNANLSVEQIAPAIRGIDTDEMGNLVVRFSVPVTERLLKQKGALAWQGLSNPVLVWMVGLDGTSNVNELTMVSGQNLSPFAQAILQSAPEYKYRLMFPILDLEDMQKVSVNTVLDHQYEALAKASERYGADYFIAAAISSVPNESGVTLKWNLYNRDGIAIANSSLSGVMDEVASLGAGDIARALMTFQKNLDQSATEQNQLTANNVDIDMLGPGEGFVRMRVGNIRTLQDINGVRRAFTSYGFDGDTRVIGYSDGQFVIEIATNSNPTNIEGTLRHGGDFTYLGPWTFNFRHSDQSRAPLDTPVGPALSDRPNSQLQASSAN